MPRAHLDGAEPPPRASSRQGIPPDSGTSGGTRSSAGVELVGGSERRAHPRRPSGRRRARRVHSPNRLLPTRNSPYAPSPAAPQTSVYARREEQRPVEPAASRHARVQGGRRRKATGTSSPPSSRPKLQKPAKRAQIGPRPRVHPRHPIGGPPPGSTRQRQQQPDKAEAHTRCDERLLELRVRRADAGSSPRRYAAHTKWGVEHVSRTEPSSLQEARSLPSSDMKPDSLASRLPRQTGPWRGSMRSVSGVRRGRLPSARRAP